MARHSTIAYPRKWIEATGLLGEVDHVPGYWIESYQEDIEFTADEESAQDIMDAEGVAKKARDIADGDALAEARVSGAAKLKTAGNLTDLEIKALTDRRL